MSFATFLARRTLLAVVAIYLVVSVSFGFVALTTDPNLAQVAYGAGHSAKASRSGEASRTALVEQAVQAYRAAHDLDRPVWQRYLDYLVRTTTLRWGDSQTLHEPVTAVLGRAIPVTLAYVIPALLFALVGGVVVGVLGALEPGGLVTRFVTGTAYVGFAVPNYWLASVVLLFGVAAAPTPNSTLLVRVVLPAAVLGLSLLAGQLRYARAEGREYVAEDFVTLLRAKGASRRRIARHVLRNAAIPLVSLFFADLLGVLVVNVFVLEQVLHIPGLGQVGLQAFQARDLPLVVGLALVIAVAGVLGTLVQDVAYRFIDPRVAVHD